MVTQQWVWLLDYDRTQQYSCFEQQLPRNFSNSENSAGTSCFPVIMVAGDIFFFVNIMMSGANIWLKKHTFCAPLVYHGYITCVASGSGLPWLHHVASASGLPWLHHVASASGLPWLHHMCS